jgi:outer membrane protein
MARTRPTGSAPGPATAAFVERMAGVTANEGFPRIAGRILALLLISERELCLDEIAARLAVSKGSISADARGLAQRGLVERVRRAGDRRDYYRVAGDLFEAALGIRLARWQAFHSAIREGRRCLPGRRGAVHERFDQLDAAFDALTGAATRALERWRRLRARAAGGRGRAAARVAGLLLAVASLGAPRSAVGQEPAPVALTLGDAARLAARQSAPADAARWRAEAAGQRVRQARADLLPMISGSVFDGQHTLNSASFGISLPGFDPNGQIIGPVRSPDVRLSGAVTLFDLSALRRVRSAGSGARAAEADAAAVAEDAAARAAVAYLVLLRAEALVDARTSDSTLASDLLTIARQGEAAGVSVALDVTRAEAQLAEARSDLISARRDRDLARLGLLRQLNLPLDTALVLRDRLDSLALAEVGSDADSAVARALRDRADVRAAAAGSEAARDRLSAVRAEALPSVAVFGDEGFTGLNWAHLLRTYEYGVKVSLPIFDGLRRSARADEQEALVREAATRERDARRQVEVEVRGALLDVASGREQAVAARERLRLAELEYTQARERFRTGVSGNADVVQASSSLNRARTRLVDALTNLQTARVALARAQGAVTTLP